VRGGREARQKRKMKRVESCSHTSLSCAPLLFFQPKLPLSTPRPGPPPHTRKHATHDRHDRRAGRERRNPHQPGRLAGWPRERGARDVLVSVLVTRAARVALRLFPPLFFLTRPRCRSLFSILSIPFKHRLVMALVGWVLTMAGLSALQNYINSSTLGGTLPTWWPGRAGPGNLVAAPTCRPWGLVACCAFRGGAGSGR